MATKRLTSRQLHAWYMDGMTTVESIEPMVNSIIGHPVTPSELDTLLRQALPRENYYQRKIIEWIETSYPDAFVRKISSGVYSEGGFPDVLVIIKGRYYGIEVKRPYVGVATKLQLQTIEFIKSAGGRAGLACFPFEARQIIGIETQLEAQESAAAIETAALDHMGRHLGVPRNGMGNVQYRQSISEAITARLLGGGVHVKERKA